MIDGMRGNDRATSLAVDEKGRSSRTMMGADPMVSDRDVKIEHAIASRARTNVVSSAIGDTNRV